MLEDLDRCAILVLSSDNYSDLWAPFFECFNKHWSNNKLPVYLGANLKEFDNKYGIKSILGGPDADWSSSLANILGKIDEDYLFVMLEDLLITSNVNNEEMKAHFSYMHKNNINHAHFLNPDIGYDQDLDHTYGACLPGAPYRVNVFGFWKKTALLHLLQQGETAWNFEIMGSYRSSIFDNFLTIKSPPFKYINLVEKGGFIPKNYDYCKNNNIPITQNSRSLLTGKTRLRSNLQMHLFHLMAKIPWRIRVKIMDTLRKILISY